MNLYASFSVLLVTCEVAKLVISGKQETIYQSSEEDETVNYFSPRNTAFGHKAPVGNPPLYSLYYAHVSIWV
jgi:hypothetical protein